VFIVCWQCGRFKWEEATVQAAYSRVLCAEIYIAYTQSCHMSSVDILHQAVAWQFAQAKILWTNTDTYIDR